MFSLLCFVDSKAQIHDYPLKVFWTSNIYLSFALANKD